MRLRFALFLVLNQPPSTLWAHAVKTPSDRSGGVGIAAPITDSAGNKRRHSSTIGGDGNSDDEKICDDDEDDGKPSASSDGDRIGDIVDECENDLNTILNGCVSSKEMIREMHNILKFDDDTSQINKIMNRDLIKVIEGFRGNINKETFRGIMNKYDEDIAVELRRKGYEANMGDGPMEDASGLAALNYATLKEILRAFKDVKEDQKRGVESKMDPAVSPCLIMVVQTIARAYVNSVRDELGLDYDKCELVLKKVLLLDMVAVPFDNEDKTSKAYYKNVEKIAANVGVQSQSRLFAICYIKFLMQVIYHRIKQGDDPSPFPVMSLSSYTRKHWFGKHDKKTPLLIVMEHDDDDDMLVQDCGGIGHPEFFMRKGPRGQSQEWRDNQNVNINQFYSALQEVIDVLASSNKVMDAMNKRFTDKTVTKDNLREYLLKMKVEAIERMDTKMTKEEREEMYKLMLEARKLGGDESGRLIVLGLALEDVCFIPEKLEGIAAEEYLHFLAKKQYSGDDGIELLLKNAKSRLEGSRLGGKVLLSLGGAIQDGKFESEEDQAIFDELLKNRYGNDEERLIQVIKNRLNGWTLCQNASRLRIAFMGKSSTISSEVYSQLDKEDKDLFDATTTMELADGTTIGEDKLYEMIAALAHGWSFCIKLPRLISIMIRTAKGSSIPFTTQADVFSMDVYNAMCSEDKQEFTLIASEMKLKSTDGQPVGIPTLLEKMRSAVFGKYNEEVVDRHISKCKQFMKENNNNTGKWYIPDCNGVNFSTHLFISRIRDLDPGDYGYWKVQAFKDAGVDLSEWKQPINNEMQHEIKDKKMAPTREEAKAVKTKKKKVIRKKS